MASDWLKVWDAAVVAFKHEPPAMGLAILLAAALTALMVLEGVRANLLPHRVSQSPSPVPSPPPQPVPQPAPRTEPQKQAAPAAFSAPTIGPAPRFRPARRPLVRPNRKCERPTLRPQRSPRPQIRRLAGCPDGEAGETDRRLATDTVIE